MTDEASLNQAFFRALQVAALRSLPDACARFGVNADFARAVADLSIEDMERLCSAGVVLWRPVMPPDQLLRLAKIEDPRARAIVARLSIDCGVSEKTTAAGPPILARKRRRA
ncbi:MAG: hypothetical protein Q8J72_05345 [Rhodocyclaceae bacterium]|nr:hypothetical protein [Rhodocyclaceae bacterium]